MKNLFILHKWYVISIAVVLLGGGVVWYVASSAPPALGTYTVTQGNVNETVDLPGAVSSDNSVDLSFQEAGQVADVYVKEGAAVGSGQPLADLDASSFRASLAQANASLAAAQAKLDGLASGTRPEMISIDQSAVASAKASLTAQMGSAYTAADDAVRNQIDNLFSNPNGNNPIFNVNSADSQLTTNIASQRVALGITFNAWYAAITGTSTDPTSLASISNTNLLSVSKYLDAVALSVNGALPGGTMSASQLASYKVNIATARTEINAATAALTGAESALTAAQGALSLAQAGATPQDIEAQNAAVLQAEAQVQSAQVAVDRSVLRAPFAGVARNVTVRVGQVIAPGSPVLSLINSGGLKIDAYASEADVSKVKSGQDAEISLDAYGSGVVFPAKVSAIDTAQTAVNGSPAYKVTLYFTQPDDRVRAGMTANVHIVAALHGNVLMVPARLVISDGTDHFVLVKNGGVVERRAVVLGATGDNGTVEVVSGLSAGETISNF